jgi:hypothetical protein
VIRCRRKLRVAIATLVGALIVQALALVPVASADTCVVTVTGVSGKKYTYTVNVAPGTPASALHLPVPEPVASVTESCTPPSTTTTTTTGSTTSTTTTTSTSTPRSSTTTTRSRTPTRPTSTSTTSTRSAKPKKQPHPKKPNQQNKPKNAKKGKGGGGTPKITSTQTSTTQAPAPSTSTSASVTATPPGFSFALPTAPPTGVPNFFIDSFRIPPFLLPIYQAAGIQYDVPWQVLAAINEIETDYGRNLSVSSAGAVGWMQFLPSTWKTWGMDANGDKVADPYNPVDAIFSAARYLHAAGASSNLSNAIFAYNHASWYVQSVLLRAKLVGGMPDGLISALSGLVEGHFPVAARSKYADDAVTALAARRVKSTNAAVPVASDPTSKAVSIFAKQGSPAIAVNDGKIVKVGENQSWGKYIQLQDQTGNIYTYAQLGQIPSEYPVPKPVKISAAQLTRELSTPALPAPKQPATAGQQRASAAGAATTAKTAAKPPAKAATSNRSQPKAAQEASSQPAGASGQQNHTPLVKERLFAYPARPNSYAAGGAVQVRAREAAQIANFQNYFSDVLHLDKNQYTLKPLKPGAVVVAGTILGRLGAGTQKTRSHLQFMIEPAGKKAPQIDPKPILDGWKLLQATAVYRANGVNPFFGAGAKNPSIGQILLMSKEQLQNRILQDPHVQIYSCGRRDIEAGLVDRRVLATLEFLSASGLDPSVSGLICGRGVLASSDGSGAAGAGGSSVDISKINNIPVSGHQGRGGIADTTIRRLLTLQGAMKPDQIISTMSYKGQTNTLALPDHSDRIQVTFTPLFGSNKKLSSELGTLLQPGQWTQLINRIGQIQEPVVPIAPSKYAVRVAGNSTN